MLVLPSVGVSSKRSQLRGEGRFGFDEWVSVTNFFDLDPLMSRAGQIEEFTGDSSEIAVAEARRLGIPTVAIVDTNADPELVNYPIAGNDDAIRSIKILLQAVTEAIAQGKAEADAKKSRRINRDEPAAAAPAPAEVAPVAPAAA